MSAGNSIFRVLARLVDGIWVFDDSKFEVKEQPFVFGSDLILEKMVAEVGEEIDRMNILFSGIPFPGSEHCLEFVREETKGFVYRWQDHNLQGWLSPSLRNYFSEPAPAIYLHLLPKT
jgi:hypothetical protein|tara:strand:+ start:439 stop:792 length:354 start_codon:yes stop_codon:yes gene_type:complete